MDHVQILGERKPRDDSHAEAGDGWKQIDAQTLGMGTVDEKPVLRAVSTSSCRACQRLERRVSRVQTCASRELARSNGGLLLHLLA